MAMKERLAISSSGWLAILVGLALMAGSIIVFAQVHDHQQAPAPYILGALAMITAGIIMLKGCFVIGPNEARVLTLFGRYAGTVKESGLRFANPFTTKHPNLGVVTVGITIGVRLK